MENSELSRIIIPVDERLIGASYNCWKSCVQKFGIAFTIKYLCIKYLFMLMRKHEKLSFWG